MDNYGIKILGFLASLILKTAAIHDISRIEPSTDA